MTQLLTYVGDHYTAANKITYELHLDSDVHAFYRPTADPSKVIHVQGYPGMSSNELAKMRARLMNYDRMMELRAAYEMIGNEHKAVTQVLLRLVEIPYDPAVLQAALERSVPELR